MLQLRCRCWLLRLQSKYIYMSMYSYFNIAPTLPTKQISRKSMLTQRIVLLVVIFTFLTFPSAFTQAAVSDDLYIHPTPALHLNKGDLTTVLLVNNDKNNGPNDYAGHHLHVRPEVGLLTSTARTFIKEGVTTEYATQVVGTTLDNGRIYAQYLKKSSRVLYDNAQQQQQQKTTYQAGISSGLLPTVVTSWIGDNLKSQNKALLESHNDLFNADQPDWQDIDDRLLHGGGNIFVSNTDFVNLTENLKYNDKQQQQNNNKIEEKSNIGDQNDSQINIFVPQNIVECERHDVNVNRVLSTADLSTFTVRNKFSPSSFSTETGAVIVDNKSIRLYKNISNIPNRSPKLYYHQLMGAKAAVANNSSDGTFKNMLSTHLFKRHFSTTTYYGFADFTTIVGDSVIVFSPSTVDKSQPFGHVTSIKGEATLGAFAIIEPSITTTMEAVHDSTEEALKSTPEIVNMMELNTAGFDDFIDLTKSSVYGMNDTLGVDGFKEYSVNTANEAGLEEVPEQKEVGNIMSNSSGGSSTIAEGIGEGDREKVLEIYASLPHTLAATATSDAFTPTILTSPLTASRMATSSLMSTEVNIDQLFGENIVERIDNSIKKLVIAARSNTSVSEQILGGATTIFFEDDPFATFANPTALLATINESMDKSTNSVSNMFDTTIKTEYLHETTTATNINDDEVNEDITSLEPKSISNSAMYSKKGFENNNSTTMSKLGQDENVQLVGTKKSFKLNVLEIKDDGGAADDNNSRLGDCIRTSQVFLTQIAKTLTKLNMYELEPQDKDKAIETSKVETVLVPTFDILETTKHYCIKPLTTTSRGVTESESDNKMGIVEEDVVQQEKPQLEYPYGAKGDLDDPSISTKKNVTITVANDVDYEVVTNKYNFSDFETDDVGSVNDNDAWYPTEDNSAEEIELIYKTLYTTYTYLTTFFNEDSKTSISSHTEVLTNVITSTLQIIGDEIASTVVVSEMFNLDSSGTYKTGHEIPVNKADSTNKFVLPTELDSILRIGEHETSNSGTVDPVQTYGVTSPLDDNKFIKTYLTTYTYYTTVFVDGETEIMSRTELYTNYIKGTITPSTVFENDTQTSVANNYVTMNDALPVHENSQYMINNQQLSNSTDVHTAATVIEDNSPPDLSNCTTVTLVTDVHTSSSNGKQHISNERPETLEDQISSESNTEEIRPSATLLLQTSYTTFTYYTTMYNNDVTGVVSRLDTITDVVTKTLKATETEIIGETALPITYFTTFTYWTKVSKNGEITTIRREETASNILMPTEISLTYIAVGNTESLNSNLQSVRATNEIIYNQKAINASTVSFASITEPESESAVEEYSAKVAPGIVNIPKVLEPTTYYTTYTYYTTSYNVNNTITDSRFETITNVVTPTLNLFPSKTRKVNFVDVSTKDVKSYQQFTDSASYNFNNDKTPTLEKSVQALLYDYKKIIDADSVSTLHFITEILPSIAADGLAIEVTSSTSSLYIDQVKKALQPRSSNTLTVNPEGTTARQYKTGLVRLIEGTRIGSHTTTLYQSKVIGTFIENRYAQIIESTSSIIFGTNSNMAMTEASFELSPSIMSVLRIDATEATQAVPMLQNSIVDNISEKNLESNSGKEDDDNDDIGEDDDDTDDDYGDSDKTWIPFQSKKRTFTPVIRPFASRNRPQFAPKKKNSASSSATIITRVDVTPTITATPALKSSGRFNTRKAGLASSALAHGAATGGSTARRSFGRPIKPTASAGGNSASNSPVIALNNASFGGNKSRLSSSARPASQSSVRRAGVLVRSSSAVGFRPGLSSAYVGNSRIRIKPTSIGLINNHNGLTTEGITTLTSDISGEESTTPELQTNEGENDEGISDVSRRYQNSLLRFRRPINRPTGFTPATQRANSGNNASSQGTAISQRRNVTSRAKTAMITTSSTTTQPPRARSLQRPQITNTPGRSRAQNRLFPPRGLFQKQTILEISEAKEHKKQVDGSEGNGDADDDSEYDDGDEEDNEDDVDGDSNRRRRSNSKQIKLSPKVKMTEKTLNAAKTNNHKKFQRLVRSRREADTSLPGRSNFRNRFRRPKLNSVGAATPAEERNFTDKVEHELSTPMMTAMTRARPGTRFVPRYTPHHSSTQAVTTSVGTTSTTSNRPIRPTRPTNARAQFTLREKDTTTTTQKGLQRHGANNFRRPQSAASSRRSSPPTSNNRRKSYNNNNLSQDTSARSPSVRARNNLSRTRTTVRGRSRNDYNADVIVPANDGTITITHVIPVEVTIPVVNGKVTEYKKVVTAKTSTEVLGSQQYTSFVGGNGQTILALTREDSSVNFGGFTEITQYFLHETPTTTIIFTPTTIRGRKTSFSHVIPSTVYSVETVVSTTQPQISANAPLANILLSQLLLGNIGLPAANPLLGAIGAAVSSSPSHFGVNTIISQIAAIPVTEYRTHSSTYVTTVFQGMSTVLPVTFQGKKILTTVYETTAQTITATEFVTDTIVTTPTQESVQMASQVNSLILQQLLLQQQIQSHIEQPQQLPLPILNSAAPQFILPDIIQELDTNNIRLSNENDNDVQMIEGLQSNNKNGRKKSRKPGKAHKRKHQAVQDEAPEGSSIITLYVSGRRPGEFSTILSTVPLGYDSTIHKRQAPNLVKQTARLDTVNDFYLTDGSEYVPAYLMPGLYGDEMQVQPIEFNISKNEGHIFAHNLIEQQTQSLESIVGDVSEWVARSTQANCVEATLDKLMELPKILKSATEIQTMNGLLKVMSNVTKSIANYNFLV